MFNAKLTNVLQQISALQKNLQHTNLRSQKWSWGSLLPLESYVLWIHQMVLYAVLLLAFFTIHTFKHTSLYVSAGIPQASALCNTTTGTFDTPNILNCNLTLDTVIGAVR